MPGLWFDEAELYSLLMAQQLLAGLDSDGLLSRHLQPLLARIHHLLGSGEGEDAASRLMERVKVVTALRRPVASRFFERVSAALLSRQRLQLRYLTRARREVGERVGLAATPGALPQHLVSGRLVSPGLDGLRRFALDAIEQAERA